MAVREIRSRGEQDMDLRGFVDDDPLKQGAVINGLKVLGSTEALPMLVPALGIDQVIITIADAPQVQLRRILKVCEGIPVRAQMIPAMYDLLQGRVSITQLREVRVEVHRELREAWPRCRSCRWWVTWGTGSGCCRCSGSTGFRWWRTRRRTSTCR